MTAQTTMANESLTWSTLYAAIGNAYGVAGLMGNLYAESALIANNLQNSYNTKLGYTDKAYTDAVDSGAYTKFSTDSAGYGLAQWTYKTRKAALLAFAQKAGASVGNLAMQLDFLVSEMKSDYAGVWKSLCNATSVKDASNVVLLKYEKPADTSASVQTKRAGYGEKYYTAYVSTNTSTSTSTSTAANTTTLKASEYAQSRDKSLSGTYKVTTNGAGLNIRGGAGVDRAVLEVIKNGETVENYGYYTDSGGVRWLYVLTKSGVEGFASSAWLTKQK